VALIDLHVAGFPGSSTSRDAVRDVPAEQVALQAFQHHRCDQEGGRYGDRHHSQHTGLHDMPPVLDPATRVPGSPGTSSTICVGTCT